MPSSRSTRRSTLGLPLDDVRATCLVAHWRDPSLLLSQTCGYPLVARLAGVVQVIGAFRYTAPGCSGTLYRSELLVRSSEAGRVIEDFRDRVAAINDPQSHSGCRALRACVAPLAQDGHFFARELESGSDRNSLALLHDGVADVAAIDCVSLAGIGRQAPELLAGLKIIGSTASAPGLPLVTSRHTSEAELGALRRALRSASRNPDLADVRKALLIGGFEVVPAKAWTSHAAFVHDPAPAHGARDAMRTQSNMTKRRYGGAARYPTSTRPWPPCEPGG